MSRIAGEEMLPPLKRGHWTNGLRPLPRRRTIPSEQFLFNLLLDRPKPLFGAGCSFLPMLNLRAIC